MNYNLTRNLLPFSLLKVFPSLQITNIGNKKISLFKNITYNKQQISFQQQLYTSSLENRINHNKNSDLPTINVNTLVSIEEYSDSQIERQFKQNSNALLKQIEKDSNQIFTAACIFSQKGMSYIDKSNELSIVLCNDSHIQKLNKTYRGEDEKTDVLSFEMDSSSGQARDLKFEDLSQFLAAEERQFSRSTAPTDEMLHDDNQGEWGTNISFQNQTLLGDVVISLETALKQAADRGHSIQDELRVLLTHGICHLLGYDHELSEEESIEQASIENKILQQFKLSSQSLISLYEKQQLSKQQNLEGASYKQGNVQGSKQRFRLNSQDKQQATNISADKIAESSRDKIKLIAIDLDGTLLNTSSEVLDSSVQVIKKALDKGIRVIIATGKARTSAYGILKKVGLAGKDLMIDYEGPGIFVNGGSAYDIDGHLFKSNSLEPELTLASFQYSDEHQVSLVSFEGDHLFCQTMTPDNERVHTFYHEPLPIVKSVDEIVKGPRSKKLLFTGPPDLFKRQVRPDMQKLADEHNANIVQPMMNMIELLPRGVNKWLAAEKLLQQMNLKAENVMVLGDGENDLEMIQNSGLGVAMSNANPLCLEAAAYITESNDNHGIAQAFEKFIL